MFNVASLTGFPILVWGLVSFDLWPTIFGIALMIGELWYIDLMAILYKDMIALKPQLGYPPSS